MDATAAERQRRYRAHKRGDHSLCPPDRADCVTVTPVVTRDGDGPSVRLRARGRRMWDQLVSDGDPIEVVVLVEEICRTADRLDRLDAIVNGRDREWIRLELPEGEAVIEVVVDKVLGEARQHQMAFKGLLAELRALRGTSAKPASKPATGGAVSGVVSLAAEAAKRRPASAG